MGVETPAFPSASRIGALPKNLRYVAVGVLCAALNNLALIVATAAGLNYLSAVFITCPPLLAIGYLIHARITFRIAPSFRAFLRYCAAMLANYPLWIGLMFLLCDVMRLPIVIAGPSGTALMFFWNFLSTHWAIPRQRLWKAPDLGSNRDALVPADHLERRSPPRQAKRLAFVCDSVSPWSKGGRETLLYEVTKRLSRPGQETHVYTMNWWRGPRLIEREGVHYHAICAYRPLYVDGKRSIGQAIWFSFAILRLLFEDFDALDVDHMPFFPLYSARIVAWLKRVPLTATWHEVWGLSYWMRYMGPLLGRIAYQIEKASFGLPDRIISDSLCTSARLAAAGVRCPVETIELGVDLSLISSITPAETVSDAIYVGRLFDHKNVDQLIRAVSILRVSRPGIRVLIVGSGPEEAKLARLTDELGLQHNVSFLGRIESSSETYALMKASKLLVLPSVREGFGLVVLEANAAGIPVVTTNHSDNAARDLIEEGVNGYCAAPTVEALAERISLALDVRKEMCPHARVADYDWSLVAERLERSLVAPPPAKAQNRNDPSATSAK